MSNVAFEVTLELPYDQAMERVTEALKEQGFGVLTRIDVHDAFREKLDIDFRKYSILGACNPQLAHKALSARPDAGLMLPCNVIVEAIDGGGALVRIIDPRAMMEMGDFGGDPTLAEVGSEADTRLRKVAASLAD